MTCYASARRDMSELQELTFAARKALTWEEIQFFVEPDTIVWAIWDGIKSSGKYTPFEAICRLNHPPQDFFSKEGTLDTLPPYIDRSARLSELRDAMVDLLEQAKLGTEQSREIYNEYLLAKHNWENYRHECKPDRYPKPDDYLGEPNEEQQKQLDSAYEVLVEKAGKDVLVSRQGNVLNQALSMIEAFEIVGPTILVHPMPMKQMRKHL